MSLATAFDKAMKDMELIKPYVTASQSGAKFESGKFRLPFFNRTFLISYPEVAIEELGFSSPTPQWLQLLLLHYLVNARGIPIADEWVAYRHLPGARLFDLKFKELALNPLVKAFGNDLESFRKAALSLGGTPMSRTGDAAFRFLALPRLPLACILYRGEEELLSSVNILFDAAAYNYLPTEDLSLVGSYLSTALQRHSL